MTSPATSSAPTPPLPERQWAQRNLGLLRFFGYAGVQLNAVLVPLLVFQLSGSAALAGLALLVEWLPKLGLYLTGGSLAQRFGRPATHLGLDLGRFAAMAGLGACALGLGSVWVVAMCAAVYQCSNALSNILFETSVTQWWPTADRAQGHARMLKADQLGCLVALLAGMALQSPAWLAAMGLVCQAFVVWRVWRLRAALYPVGSQQAPAQPLALAQQLRTDAKAALQRPLMSLALAAALMGIPAALAFSALAYFLDRAQPGAAASAQGLSTLLLLRTLLSLLVLQGVQAQLRRGGREGVLAKVGVAVLVCSSLALAAPLPLWALFGAVAMLGTAGSFFTPFLRHLRQALISQHVEAPSRAGVTGMLISVEAGAYLAAAGLLAGLGAHLGVMALIAALLGLVGSALLLRRHAPTA